MSKTVPELGKTVKHLIDTAAQVAVHDTPFEKKRPRLQGFLKTYVTIADFCRK
jgi:hypothetical protein